MEENRSNKRESYYKRVIERHFWANLGLVLMQIGLSVFVLSVAADFLGISLGIVNLLTYVGFIGVISGGFFNLILGRIGWSESILIDLLFNRLSVIFMLVGLVLMGLRLGIGYTSDTISYDIILITGGTILALLGMFFHSSTVNDPRIKD